jgi:hypothetical protein
MRCEAKLVYIVLRMRYWRLIGEPEVFQDFEEAKALFEEYTRTSWEDVESLVEEAGADPDTLVGGPFAGTTILSVEVPWSCCRAHAA